MIKPHIVTARDVFVDHLVSMREDALTVPVSDTRYWTPNRRQWIRNVDPNAVSHEEAVEILNAWWCDAKVIKCDACEREVDRVIEMGVDHDYEQAPARVCFDCVGTAANLIGGLSTHRAPEEK